MTAAKLKAKEANHEYLKLLEGVTSFVPAPRGMMKDCPLGVNATAATSKSSTYLPEPARGPVAALPAFEKQPLHTEYLQLFRSFIIVALPTFSVVFS